MITVGIICEYNPLHLGHRKQMRLIKSLRGPETAIVCLMSGSFVQRGAPAIFDKTLRAKAAIAAGADLVLELPVEYSLSSAEGFADGGVAILGDFCDELCFGAEDADGDALMATARALLSEEFPPILREELEKGLSFPAARQAALTRMGLDGELVASPNNILAVEYCKAMAARNTKMQPMPITREGSYHDKLPDDENPSATALRRLLTEGGDWKRYVPAEVAPVFEGAEIHTALDSRCQNVLYFFAVLLCNRLERIYNLELGALVGLALSADISIERIVCHNVLEILCKLCQVKLRQRSVVIKSLQVEL